MGNDLYVPLKQGEVYEIHIEVKPSVEKPLLMRLLVDGLNTLPEPQRWRTRGFFVEPVSFPAEGSKPEPTEVRYVPAQRVSLEEASSWLLDPQQTRLWAVRGFVVDVEQQRYRQFEVVDAAELPTQRRQFTDQLGIITAAFYEAEKRREADPISRSVLATRPGAEKEERIETYTGFKPGQLVGILHIRYGSQEEWEKLPAAPVPFE